MSSCVLFRAFWPRVLRDMLNHSRPQVDSRVHICLQWQKSNGLLETGVAQDQETVLLLPFVIY